MAVFCGIDWAEGHRDVALVDGEGRLVAKRRISESPDGIAELTAMLTAAGDSAEQPIPVAIEASRRPGSTSGTSGRRAHGSGAEPSWLPRSGPRSTHPAAPTAHLGSPRITAELRAGGLADRGEHGGGVDGGPAAGGPTEAAAPVFDPRGQDRATGTGPGRPGLLRGRTQSEVVRGPDRDPHRRRQALPGRGGGPVLPPVARLHDERPARRRVGCGLAADGCRRPRRQHLRRHLPHRPGQRLSWSTSRWSRVNSFSASTRVLQVARRSRRRRLSGSMPTKTMARKLPEGNFSM